MVYKLLRNIEVTKATEIDKNLRKFLKGGMRISSKPISELCNLSMALRSFPDACKFVKLTPLFKNGSKTDLSSYRPISLLPLLSVIKE